MSLFLPAFYVSGPAGAALAAGSGDMNLAAGIAGGGPAVFWIAFLFILAFLFIVRFNPLKLLVAPFRVGGRMLLRLLRGVLRVLRLARRGTRGGTRAIAPSSDNLGILGPVARAFGSETLTDQLLADYAVQEKNYVQRRGALFRWIHPLPQTIPSADKTDAESEDEAAYTDSLFQFNIPINEMLARESTLHQYFYEDIENQFIIRLFRGADSENPEGYIDPEDPGKGKRKGPDDTFYFIGDLFRKYINGNVRRLATLQTLILTFVFLTNVFFSYIYDAVYANLGVGIMAGWELLPPGDYFTILVFFIAFTLILLLNMFYGFSQRNNARELDTYVRSYLAYINARFRLIDAAVTRLIAAATGQDRQGEAGTGMNKLQWLGWRTFSIEKFLRGIFYQIKRNTFNYMLFIPVAFALLTWGTFMGIQSSLSPGKSFTQAWFEYRECRVNFEDPLTCAKNLTAARKMDIGQLLNTYTNCVTRDTQTNVCTETLSQRMATRIAQGREDDRHLAISVDDGPQQAEAKLDRLSAKIIDENNLTSQAGLFILLFTLQIAWYVFNLLRAPRTVRESIEEGPWLEYHKLQLNRTTQNIIGRFAREIERLVNLYGGRGGGGH